MKEALVQQTDVIEKKKRQLRTLYSKRADAQSQLEKCQRTLKASDDCYAIWLTRRPWNYWFSQSVRSSFDDLMWKISGRITDRVNYEIVNRLNGDRYPHTDTPVEKLYKSLRADGKACVRDHCSLDYVQYHSARIIQQGGKAYYERTTLEQEQADKKKAAEGALRDAETDVENVKLLIAPQEEALETLRLQAREQKKQMLAAGDIEGVMQYAMDRMTKLLKLKDWQLNVVDDYWQDDCADGEKRMVIEIGDDFTEEEVFDREEVVGTAEFYPDGSWRAYSTVFDKDSVHYAFGSDADEDLLMDQAVEYLKEGLEYE